MVAVPQGPGLMTLTDDSSLSTSGLRCSKRDANHSQLPSSTPLHSWGSKQKEHQEVDRFCQCESALPRACMTRDREEVLKDPPARPGVVKNGQYQIP